MTSLKRLARSRSSGFMPLPLLFLTGALFTFSTGCSQKEQEVTPEVSVQVQPARSGEISQLVTAEAVVFPLQQAIVTPKITSTIKSFQVQRGARVRKGQLLAVLENADLSAAAVQSKGEYGAESAPMCRTRARALRAPSKLEGPG